MDALSEILRVCRLRGAAVLNADLGGPWQVAVGATPALLRSFLPDAESPAIFHLVLSGECRLQLPGGAPLALQAGDGVLLVHGTVHRLMGGEGAHEVTLTSLVKAPIAGELIPTRHGGSGERTRIVTCLAAMERPLCDPILEALPHLVKANLRGSAPAKVIEDAMGFSLSGSEAPRAGGLATLSKLAELLFIEIVRRHVEASPPNASGWVAGLNDRYVGRALALMHGKPGEDWTVEKLARQVRLSRSALAERFVQFLGEPPISYLSRWRLRLAAHKLASTRRTVESIAADAGYESSSAFAHAFKTTFGKPPSIWRKRTNRGQIPRSAPRDLGDRSR